DMKTPKRAAEFSDYRSTVEEWHAAIEKNYKRFLTEELADGQCGGFLAWGDPTLYDSTLRILATIKADRFALDYDVIPGLSRVPPLAAQHRVPLNRIGEPVLITPARKLAEGLPDTVDSVVVVLDGEQTFRRLDGEAYDIYWGAYLGTPDEILVAG